MFRFTIRELVLLTLVVAMGVGWWLDRSALNAWHVGRLAQILTELHSHGFRVERGEDGIERLVQPLK
jgi:uncharacterized protein (DUF3820 family)